MFIHMTVVWIDALQVEVAVRILAERLSEKDRGIPDGLVKSHLLESMDEPGRIIWLSYWTAHSKAQAYVTSREYATWFDQLQPYMISGPEWKSYRVLEK